MDIFAHGLWAAAAARGLNRKSRRRVSVVWTAWWGIFPDLFAFAPAIGFMLWQRLSDVPAPATPPHGPGGPAFNLAWGLYQISHSFIIFGAAFGFAWLIARRPWLPTLGWALHIVIDIPTHTARFFPTPFLWPVSSYTFNGISWGNPWFMAVNWGAIAAVYLLLWRTGRRRRKEQYARDLV
jgi:hypothetical protein